MLVAFSIAPSQPDSDQGSYADTVSQIVAHIRNSGLPNETNAMFTNVEGEWDEVMQLVKECCDIAASKTGRASLVLKADIRPGHNDMLTAKVSRIEDRLGKE